MRAAKRSVLVAAAALCGLASAASSEPMGTAFTYQGQLKQTGVPVNAHPPNGMSFRFSLWDDQDTPPGVPKGDPITKHAVEVTNGLFTVKLNEAGEFGAEAFNGEARWLEIAVCRTPDDCMVPANYSTLLPRQELTPGPYALFAPDASGGGGDAWLLSGNAATDPLTDFLGTTDNLPLELHVNGSRALRIEPNSVPNIIGGFGGNRVADGMYGGTISGGGFSGFPNQVSANYATISGGEGNTASGAVSIVSGGSRHTARGSWSTVGGGQSNTANGDRSTVSGGSNNSAGGSATVAGGGSNAASGTGSSVGGGFSNTASGFASTVPGGQSNTAAGRYSVAAGRGARANYDGTFVWADSDGDSGVAPPFDSTGPDQFLIRARGGVGIGKSNPGEALDVEGNIKASGTIKSGSSIMIDGTAGSEKITSSDALELHLSSGRALRLEPNGGSPNLIGGHSENNVTELAFGATIGGGGRAGAPNRVTDVYGTVGGGMRNQAGSANEAFADAWGATVGGGVQNVASGRYSAIPGGFDNAAGGEFSFAAGNRARVRSAEDVQAAEDPTDTDGDEGTFVWADSTQATFTSTGPDQFLIRATGGVGIGTNDPLAKLHIGGTAGVDGIMFPDGTLQTSALAGGGGGDISGSGTPGYLAKFTGTNSIGDSIIYEDGGKIGIDNLQIGSVTHGHGMSTSIVTTGPPPFYLPTWNRSVVSYDGSSLRLLADSTTELPPPPISPTSGITIKNHGNVGIGTTAPGASLEVRRNSSVDTPQLKLTESAADYSRLTFANTENSRFWTIAGLTRNDPDTGFPDDNLNFFHSFAGDGFSIRVGTSGVARVGIGTTNPQARLDVRGRTRTDILEITGADLAEKFPVSEETKPGMVVAIDPDNPGQLHVARGVYNRRVAGVVSGANGLSVGVVLGNLPGQEDAPPIALSGRVWTLCDASDGPIVPGDLLTTSGTPGHGMRVTDHTLSQGAILGKAMTALESGKGLVLVLVTLQ